MAARSVLPEVASLPPGDLLEQGRSGAAMHCRGRQHRWHWSLRRSRPPPVLGQETLPDPSERQRIGKADAGPGERVG
jgi:hypothetical protein